MRFFPILFFAIPLIAQDVPAGSGTIPIEVISPVSATIPPDRVVLQVGDIKITAQQLDHLIDVYPASTQVYVRGAGRQQFADTVVRMLVLSNEARKRKLNETEKFKEQSRFSEDNVLANLVNEQIAKD